jgi:RHS repeat-associated protein
MGALKNTQYDIPSGGGAARTCGYVWDRAGNRSSMSDSAGPSCSYQTTHLNQYSQVGGDLVFPGNWHELGSYQNISYTYVNDTRLASVSGNGYNYTVFYDALGRCVVRTTDGSTSCYVYDGEKPIVEYGGSFVKTATNVYGRGIDEILQRTDFTYLPNRLFYYQDDHEGNVTHLMMQINNTPTVVESYRYDAFGKPTITNTSGIVTNNRFMFTGREYVSQFGIYEYRNRAYHPGLGRFMSEDPKLFDAGDYNLFRYCHNDPIDFTDPMGLDYGPFGSFEAALTFAQQAFHPGAQHDNKEFAQDVYKFEKTKHYYVNDPKFGKENSARSSGQIPKSAKNVGNIHDHGQYSKREGNRIVRTTREHDEFDSENPSKPDRKNWDKQANGKEEWKGGLIGPSGKLTERDHGKEDEINGRNFKEGNTSDYRKMTAEEIEEKEKSKDPPALGGQKPPPERKRNE